VASSVINPFTLDFDQRLFSILPFASSLATEKLGGH
jgi:hypothetical protein